MGKFKRIVHIAQNRGDLYKARLDAFYRQVHVLTKLSLVV